MVPQPPRNGDNLIQYIMKSIIVKNINKIITFSDVEVFRIFISCLQLGLDSGEKKIEFIYRVDGLVTD